MHFGWGIDYFCPTFKGVLALDYIQRTVMSSLPIFEAT